MNKPLVVAGVVLTLFSLTALALAWWSAYRVTQIQKTMNTADKNPTLDSHTPSGDDSPTPVLDQSQDALVMTKPMTDKKYTLVTLGDLSVNRQAYNGHPIEIIDYMDTGPLPSPNGTKKYTEYIKILSPDYVRGLDLVYPPFTTDDPARYARVAPLYRGEQRVSIKGKFVIDLMKTPTRPIENDVIVVDHFDILPFPEPEKGVITKEIFSQMIEDGSIASLNRKRITYEGEYGSGFEVSLLDKLIWVNFIETEMGNAVDELERFMRTHSEMKKEDGQMKSKVRVTGVLYATPGQRYGHLGRTLYQMMVDTVVFLEQ
ncbi:MAG: hypothetical protein WBO92_00080 [Candidatus Moraniibacteriota bacterium]